MKKLKHFKFCKGHYYKFINSYKETLILKCLGKDNNDGVYKFNLLEIKSGKQRLIRGDIVYYNRNVDKKLRKSCKCYKLTKSEAFMESI
jgi:hypothetical protein